MLQTHIMALSGVNVNLVHRTRDCEKHRLNVCTFTPSNHARFGRYAQCT